MTIHAIKKIPSVAPASIRDVEGPWEDGDGRASNRPPPSSGVSNARTAQIATRLTDEAHATLRRLQRDLDLAQYPEIIEAALFLFEQKFAEEPQGLIRFLSKKGSFHRLIPRLHKYLAGRVL